jgi:hypothetical protein
MSSVSQIRTAIQGALGTIFREAHDVEPAKLNPPCAIVSAVSGDYQQVMGPMAQYAVEVVLLASLIDDPVRGQRRLDAYLAPAGETSVRVALESDPTLGGVVDVISAVRFRDAGIIDRQGVNYIGAFVDVLVWAS